MHDGGARDATARTRPRRHRSTTEPVSHAANQRDRHHECRRVAPRGRPCGGASRAAGCRAAGGARPTSRRGAGSRCAGCLGAATRPTSSDCAESVRSSSVVEVVEGRRPVDEVGDVAGLVGVHARRDVDQHRARPRGQCARRTGSELRPPSDIPTSGSGVVMRRRAHARRRARGSRWRSSGRARGRSGRVRAGRARGVMRPGRARRCRRCARSELRRGASTSSGSPSPQRRPLSWRRPSTVTKKRSHVRDRPLDIPFTQVLVEERELVVREVRHAWHGSDDC